MAEAAPKYNVPLSLLVAILRGAKFLFLIRFPSRRLLLSNLGGKSPRGAQNVTL